MPPRTRRRRDKRRPTIGVLSAYPEVVITRAPRTSLELQDASGSKATSTEGTGRFEFHVTTPPPEAGPTGLDGFQALVQQELDLIATLGQLAGSKPRKRKGASEGTPGGTLDATVRAELKQGFLRAGRADLARMVDTREFSTWVRQESGGRPTAVSPANNMGLPNGGLFQFWAGHSWARPYFHGRTFTMPVAQQAYSAAHYFSLTPARIIEFAHEIQGGSYRGWG